MDILWLERVSEEDGCVVAQVVFFPHAIVDGPCNIGEVIVSLRKVQPYRHLQSPSEDAPSFAYHLGGVGDGELDIRSTVGRLDGSNRSVNVPVPLGMIDA